VVVKTRVVFPLRVCPFDTVVNSETTVEVMTVVTGAREAVELLVVEPDCDPVVEAAVCEPERVVLALVVSWTGSVRCGLYLRRVIYLG
jgi:sorbitol-specific phosphotransferase system component IIBC